MGLLDDAIREHLELKRQHGAPDDEIERAEQEALAPARRDPAAEAGAGAGLPPLEEVPGEDIEPPPPPPPPVEEAPVAEAAPADLDVDGEEEDYLAPEPLADEPELEEAPFPGTPKPHGDPALGDEEHMFVTPDEPADGPEPQPDPEPPVEPDRARTSILDDPLREGPDPEENEDLLEETPDFLQESPEHDKLWFEQKPPRDFDFD